MTTDTLTRPGPTDSFTDEQGARFYEIDGNRYWSVTTALKVIAKDGLVPWAGNLAAAAAFDELPKVIRASRLKPCGNTYSQCRRANGGHDWRVRCSTCPCRECQVCMAKWLADRHLAIRDRRADEGRRTHDWIENWVISGGVVAPMSDDIAPYVRAFLAFVKCYGLTPDSWLLAEATVVSRAEEYAGTTDGVLRFEASATDDAAAVVAMLHQKPKSVCVAERLVVDVIVDFKTKDEPQDKEIKFYDEVALQLAPYRFAPVVRIKRLGIEEPMPDTHGGMAVQLRPDMAIPRLCVVDETTHEAFLKALWLYRWRIERGAASVSVRSFKVPKEPEPPKPARPARTTPAKAAPRKAAKAAPEKPTEQEALIPAPPVKSTRASAAAQSAQLRSMTRPAHPDSPYGDDIPF